MKLKCPVCNKPVSTYTVNGEIHCALCNAFIRNDPQASKSADAVALEPTFDSSPDESDAYNSTDTVTVSEHAQECVEEKVKKHFIKKKVSSDHTNEKAKRSVTRKEDGEADPNSFEDQESKIDVNEDGFYDDVPPEILSEIEHLPKEVFLKIIAAVIALFGTIVFLIFYF